MKKCRICAAILVLTIFMTGILNAFAVTEQENVTDDPSKGYFELLDYKIVANKVVFTGIAPYACDTKIMFYATEGENVIAAKQITSESDGTFDAVLVLTTERYNDENTATIVIGAEGTNSVRITGIPLYSQRELDECVLAFKDISGKEEMKEFFLTYSEMLDITDTYADDELEILFGKYNSISLEDVHDCDSVISVIENLVTDINKYRMFFDEINIAAQKGDWAEIKRLLTLKYVEFVNFSTDVPLIHNERELYLRMTGENVNYSSISEIEQAFLAAVEAQKLAEAVDGAVTEDREFDFANEWKVSVAANYITVSGRCEETGVRDIAFYVTDYNVSVPNVLAVFQTETAQDGSFSASFTLNPQVYKDETLGIIKVSGADVNVWQFCIPLYSNETLLGMTESFKDISSEEEMETFFADYGSILEIGEGYGSDKIKLLYELFAERDFSAVNSGQKVAAELTQLNKNMDIVREFISEMNYFSSVNNWGNIQRIIERDYMELSMVSSTFEELQKCVEKADGVSKKGVYLRMTKQEFECIRDVIDSFNRAYEEQYTFENSENNKKPTGGSGGGGGGSFNPGTKLDVSTELIPEPQKEDVDATKLPVAKFVDLEGFTWAENAINGLRNLSIIRGDGEGYYRPADGVTREEFLSMLLDTFYVERISGRESFDDVESGAWYCDTVATAYKLGITKGKGDGTFGIGENITRADMIVLTARLFRTKEIVINQTIPAKVFEDYEIIPDYAYNDVVAFQQAGFVNGNENGYFKPIDNLTRAEAAVFFWNVYSFIEDKI